MFKYRVITALVLAPLVIGFLLWAPKHTIWWALAIPFAIAGYEWAQFAGIRERAFRWPIGIVIGGAIPLLQPYLGTQTAVMITGIASAGWLLSLIWLANPDWGRAPTATNFAFKLLVGILILISSCLAIGYIFNLAAGRAWILTLLAIVWAADIGAYFTGKAIGKRKLAPRISPGKSWEGVYGGLAAAAGVGACSTLVPALSDASAWKMSLLAVAVAAISIVGDLLASLLKRHAELKDSGHLLPGHGGIIDRIDSLLAAAPVYFVGLSQLVL